MGLRRAQDRRRLHATTASADHREVGRRVRAACTLAELTLLDAARATGISYLHLVAVVGARESLTATGGRDLAALLGYPADWLARGWDSDLRLYP